MLIVFVDLSKCLVFGRNEATIKANAINTLVAKIDFLAELAVAVLAILFSSLPTLGGNLLFLLLLPNSNAEGFSCEI